ncbi:MAG TPA: glycosyltransferase [Nocardioides sp.]|nr:glycosyltransferase [Nocardioides sp.]
MAQILFVTWDGGGNVPPALALARELQRRGHVVRFLGHPRQRADLEAAGFDVVRTRYTRAFSSLTEHSTPDLLAAFTDRGMGRDLLEAVTTRQPDLVVVDCLLFGALDAARRSGTPYVVLEHFYDGYYESGCLRSPMALVARARRLRPGRAVAGAAGRLVLAHPELDRPGRRGRAPEVRHVGPVVPPRRPAEPPSAPCVLVSLSTFAFRGMAACLQRIVDAAAAVAPEVVVTTGPAVDPAELRHPAHVRVHRYVEHATLMPRATAFVGHGGHGSTMQALVHDLPMALLPQDSRTDQPTVARSIEEAGAGVVLDRKAGTDVVAGTLARLLGDGSYREAAARVGAAVRAMPGAVLGADAVEQLLLAERRPGARSRDSGAGPLSG